VSIFQVNDAEPRNAVATLRCADVLPDRAAALGEADVHDIHVNWND
jgi:hypothetical protein